MSSVILSSLRQLCIKYIVNRIGHPEVNICQLKHEIPETLFCVLVKERCDSFWQRLFEQSYLLNRNENLYLKLNIDKYEIDWESFDFIFYEFDENLLLYLILFEDWDEIYDEKYICMQFEYVYFNSLYICRWCWFKYTEKYKFHVNREHNRTNVRYNLQHCVSAPDNWCNICLKTPLFSVMNYTECCIKTHNQIKGQKILFEL